ncbi:MAG: hypothetical protein ABH870_01735 [bacterium]
MLWQISSGDLNTIILSDKEHLREHIMKAIDTEKPESLGTLIHCRRLTGWSDSVTKDDIEANDVYSVTEDLLKEYGKWELSM